MAPKVAAAVGEGQESSSAGGEGAVPGSGTDLIQLLRRLESLGRHQALSAGRRLGQKLGSRSSTSRAIPASGMADFAASAASGNAASVGVVIGEGPGPCTTGRVEHPKRAQRGSCGGRQGPPQGSAHLHLEKAERGATSRYSGAPDSRHGLPSRTPPPMEGRPQQSPVHTTSGVQQKPAGVLFRSPTGSTPDLSSPSSSMATSRYARGPRANGASGVPLSPNLGHGTTAKPTASSRLAAVGVHPGNPRPDFSQETARGFGDVPGHAEGQHLGGASRYTRPERAEGERLGHSGQNTLEAMENGRPGEPGRGNEGCLSGEGSVAWRREGGQSGWGEGLGSHNSAVHTNSSSPQLQGKKSASRASGCSSSRPRRKLSFDIDRNAATYYGKSPSGTPHRERRHSMSASSSVAASSSPHSEGWGVLGNHEVSTGASTARSPQADGTAEMRHGSEATFRWPKSASLSGPTTVALNPVRSRWDSSTPLSLHKATGGAAETIPSHSPGNGTTILAPPHLAPGALQTVASHSPSRLAFAATNPPFRQGQNPQEWSFPAPIVQQAWHQVQLQPASTSYGSRELPWAVDGVNRVNGIKGVNMLSAASGVNGINGVNTLSASSALAPLNGVNRDSRVNAMTGGSQAVEYGEYRARGLSASDRYTFATPFSQGGQASDTEGETSAASDAEEFLFCRTAAMRAHG